MATSVTLQQAVQNSPTLANLLALAMESQQRLKSVEALIPVALRTAVSAGPIEGNTWCLLVNHNAAAAKLRQIAPSLQASLLKQGVDVITIRIKVKTPGQS